MIGCRVKICYNNVWIFGTIVECEFFGGVWYYVIISDLTRQILHVDSVAQKGGIYFVDENNKYGG